MEICYLTGDDNESYLFDEEEFECLVFFLSISDLLRNECRG